MAVAKSTIINAPGNSTSATMVVWSTISTDANNVYFDMRGVQGDRAIILLASLNSSDNTATSTSSLFWLGASNSAASGASGVHNYSARRQGRMGLDFYSSNAGGRISLSPSTAAGKIAISVAGPFETARFKDTDGQIQFSKRKGADDELDMRVAMIVIP